MKAVNLLPPDLRLSPRAAATAAADVKGGPGAYIVLGALALAVVALAGYVLAGNTVKQRESDLATVSAQAAVVNRQVDALKPYADFDAVAKARVKTVEDLVGQRFAWDRALRDISRAVPADVTLTQLDGTVSAGSGGGASPIRGALDVPAFELQGCTSDQTAVARLMSRLRMVGGVTRVSLAKSDKDTQSPRPAGTGDTSVAIAGVGACGKGDKPTFDLIAFFEDAGQAIASATATATPQATADPAAGGTATSSTSTTTAAEVQAK